MLTKTDLSEIKKVSDLSIREAINKYNLSTKEDINKALIDYNSELFKVFLTKQDAQDLIVSKAEFHESVDTLQNIMDKIYGIVKKIDQEQTVMSHQVNNHESRLTKVETAIA